MDSNKKIDLKLDDNNPPSFQAEGSITKSKDEINSQNIKKNDDDGNKIIQIIIHNKSDKKDIGNINKNSKDNSSIRVLPNNKQLNKKKTNEPDNDLDLDLNKEFSVKNKSPNFLKKVYGILSIQFIFILGLVLILQIKNIKNKIKNHSNLFWAFFSISLLGIIIMVLLFISDKISKEAPCSYIAVFFFASFIGLFFGFIGAYTNFHVILGIITCMLSIFVASLIFVLLYKGILNIIEKYNIDEYTLATFRIILDTIGMVFVICGGTGRRHSLRKIGRLAR
jgi:hypothetical protein